MANFINVAKLIDLLKAADGNGDSYVVLRDNHLLVGANPLHPSVMLDFSAEQLAPISGTNPHQPAAQHQTPALLPARISRRSGTYWFELRGRRTDCTSLKELLAESLMALEKIRPGTIEDLSRLRGRNRRIVAHNPADLYDKAHLADEYAEKLMNGWYYGTNNSAQQTKTWLARAAECARLSSTDFRTSLD